MHLLPKDLVSDLDFALNSKLVGFAEEGYITEVPYVVKSGKEATVYCCRATPSTGYDFLAAKLYRPGEFRGNKNTTKYTEGRVILDRRTARAVKNKSKRGRDFESNMWMGVEFEVMNRLYDAGADIPEPIFQSGASPPFDPVSAMLIEYIGDEEGVAPMLRNAKLPRGDARRLFNRLMDNIELCLSCNVIHGDLSPFNILYWEGELVIIDFPQAVDPRANPNAFELLLRDLENVCRYWEPYGLTARAFDIADDLWQRWTRGNLT